MRKILTWTLSLGLGAWPAGPAWAQHTQTYSIAHDDPGVSYQSPPNYGYLTWCTGSCLCPNFGTKNWGTQQNGSKVVWQLKDNFGAVKSVSVGLPKGCQNDYQGNGPHGVRVYLNGIEVGFIINGQSCCGGPIQLNSLPSTNLASKGAFYNAGIENNVTFLMVITHQYFIASSGNYTLTVNGLKVSSESRGFVSTTNPTLGWDAFGGATGYLVEVCDTPFFDPPLYTATVPGTSYALTGLNNGRTYYWRVKANDGTFEPGVFQPTIAFTIDTTAPPTPTLISPADGATNVPQKPTFSWGAVTSGEE